MSRERRQMSIRMEPYIQLAFILYSDACWYFKDAAATI